MGRVLRIGLLAFATALLICYQPHILSWSGSNPRPEPPALNVVGITTPENQELGSKGSSADTKWPTTSPAETVYSEQTDAPSQQTDPSPQDSTSGALPPSPPPTSAFNEEKYPFQEDLPLYAQPAFDVAKLKRYRPHNDRGPGQSAFATYLSTRDSSVHDPYFLSAMQLVYRLLWDPKSRSASHPVVVFVAPFIPAEQRDLLRAAGAVVRELDLVPWNPPGAGGGGEGGGSGDDDDDGDIMFPFARWRDLFSKLNIWGQLDLARVAFLDLDAFPVRGLDGLLDDGGTRAPAAPRQRCRAELLPPEDRAHEGDICDYVFAGHGLLVGGGGGVNVGVMVLEPNRYMHQRLLRESRDTGKFDNRMAEQAFLNYAFAENGPFPPTLLGREWNGFYPQAEEEGLLRVVHEKLWTSGSGELAGWTRDIFKNGWFELLTLYQSGEFELMRAGDGLVEQPLVKGYV